MGERDGESDRELENCNARWGVFLFAWHFCFLRALFRQPSLSATFYKAWVKWVKKLPDGIGFKEIKSIVFH